MGSNPGHERVPAWEARAFGTDLELTFEAPFLKPLTRPSSDATRVDLVDADAIQSAWPTDEARRTGLMGPEDDPMMTVHEHPDAGYLIRLPPYGIYRISPDGRQVDCAPPVAIWWHWQRLLVGQILPAVAALRGAEVLHASAIEIGRHAFAFAGDPGLGKSSLALQLMLRGHRLVSEDAVSIEPKGDGGVTVAPGAGLLNLRTQEYELVGSDAVESLGPIVGRSDDKVHAVVDLEPEHLPLGALYLLERDGRELPVFERIPAPGFGDVYRNAFVIYVMRADRMINQLDLAARIARTVPVFRLRVQPGTTARELAAEVEAHAERLVAETA